jgi:hypothetical protein
MKGFEVGFGGWLFVWWEMVEMRGAVLARGFVCFGRVVCSGLCSPHETRC